MMGPVLRRLLLLTAVPIALVLMSIPVVAVGPRVAHAAGPVNWQYKGFTFAPYSQDELGNSNTAAALQQLAATGANAVTFAVTWYTDNVYSTNIYRTGNTASDASLITAIGEARALGLQVMIKPHVDSLDGLWRAHIHPCSVTYAEPCPAANDLASAWFSNYTTIMNHYADLAQQQGASVLCVGAELIDLSTNNAYTGYWRSLIAGVRSRFSGRLTYSANWGSGSFGTEYTRIPFWDALDYIGISAYFPLATTTTPTVQSMVAAWQNYMPQIQSVQTTVGKPVMFTEGGFRSVDGTAERPFDSSFSGPSDLQEQADAYEATFEAWANVPWFVGSAFWQFSTDPNSNPYDTSYVVQNKPAYNTVTTWFSGTAGAPRPTATMTQVPGATATMTPRPTATSTPTNTPTSTSTSTSTATALATAATSACAAGWSCGDIGAPSLSGGQSLSGGTWTVQGAGSDIWNSADQFHYVWQSLTGDGAASARVLSQTNTDGWAKGGIMFRQGTDPGAPYYAVYLTPSNGINVQYRPSPGAGAMQLASVGGGLPSYLKVARSGSLFTAYTSNDGTTWTAIGGSSTSLSMPSTLLAGLAVTSHNSSAQSTVTFDTVHVGLASVSTATPTSTSTATATSTSTAISAPTATSTSTAISAPTATSTSTAISAPTATSTSTVLSAPTATSTSTVLSAPTATSTSTVPATATPTAAGTGPVSARGTVTSTSNPYWSEEDIVLDSGAPLTALRVTVTVQKTLGVSFSGEYTTFAAGAMMMAYTDTGSALVYTYTLASGQTIPSGSGYVIGSQFGGSGTPHPYGNDTYTVTATTGGGTTTTSGHF